MPSKLKFKIIKDPVFRSETLFYVCDNGDDAIAHAKKKHKVNIDNPGFDGFNGICVELFDPKTKITFWFIWIRNKKDWKTMVHEASHLVFRILDHRLVKYDSSNDETWCYLHEYYISEFWHEMCK